MLVAHFCEEVLSDAWLRKGRLFSASDIGLLCRFQKLIADLHAHPMNALNKKAAF